MGMGPEAVMVTHVGGTYGDREASRARWLEGCAHCPEPVRRRLVLENDDLRFSAADVLWIHERCGVPLILDYQHFWCLNPEGLDLRETLERVLRDLARRRAPEDPLLVAAHRDAGAEAQGHRPASARRRGRGGRRRALSTTVITPTTRVKTVLVPPVWTGHADFVNPFEFATFMRLAEGLEFDVMLEGKSKDLSLLRLRQDMARYAPDVAARFGITPQEATDDEEQLEDGVDADEEADVDVGRREAAE